MNWRSYFLSLLWSANTFTRIWRAYSHTWQSGKTFNSCLLNLYQSGEEGMAWHSDAEKDLKKNGKIASLSFGSERKFAFKHKESKETITLILDHGSLPVMKYSTQSHWLHRLAPAKLISRPKTNLTFRSIDI